MQTFIDFHEMTTFEFISNTDIEVEHNIRLARLHMIHIHMCTYM